MDTEYTGWAKKVRLLRSIDHIVKTSATDAGFMPYFNALWSRTQP